MYDGLTLCWFCL